MYLIASMYYYHLLLISNVVLTGTIIYSTEIICGKVEKMVSKIKGRRVTEDDVFSSICDPGCIVLRGYSRHKSSETVLEKWK